MPNKHLRVSDEIHNFIFWVKVYSGISMEEFTNELIKEASISPVLEKVLMNFLFDRKKVQFILNKLQNNTNVT